MQTLGLAVTAMAAGESLETEKSAVLSCFVLFCFVFFFC